MIELLLRFSTETVESARCLMSLSSKLKVLKSVSTSSRLTFKYHLLLLLRVRAVVFTFSVLALPSRIEFSAVNVRETGRVSSS